MRKGILIFGNVGKCVGRKGLLGVFEELYTKK